MPTRNKSKLLRMENLRRVAQVLFFLLFVSLFALTVAHFDAAAKHIILKSSGPVDLFFQADPLLALTSMISIRQIIVLMLVTALPIVLLTAIAGRFFCGWICPMGTAIDASDKLFFKKRRQKPDFRFKNIKYYLLIGILIAAVFSGQIAYLLDPFAILTRAFTFAIFPMVQLGMQSISNMGVSVQSPFLPSDVSYFYRLNFLAAIMLIAILAAGTYSRRFWCRNLCPLGALLGILSRFSIIRRIVKSDCIKCTKCIPDCKMGAIEESITNYRAPECIYCYSCTAICPSLSTAIMPTIKSKGHHAELDLTRRRAIQAVGIGAVVALLGKTNAAAKASRTGKVKTSSELLIRPPGSVPEDEFVDRCLRCSECMKVCPTNGLQPALTEAGFEGLWTPVLVPKLGECSRQCNLCSQVCASEAIKPFDIKEKSHIYIGTAVIDRSRCIAWNSDKQCLVCDEHCSYHALYWKDVDGIRRPFVEEHKCVGCGICENACPIQPSAAIRIYSFGDKRYMTRDQQKVYFDQSPNHESNAKGSVSPYGGGSAN